MKYLIKNKHWEINKKYNIDKILYLLIDRPDIITHFNNDFIWCKQQGNVLIKWRRKYNLPYYG